MKQVRCTKLVNTVKVKEKQIMLIKHMHEGKCNQNIREVVKGRNGNYYWPIMKNDVTQLLTIETFVKMPNIPDNK